MNFKMIKTLINELKEKQKLGDLSEDKKQLLKELINVMNIAENQIKKSIIELSESTGRSKENCPTCGRAFE